MLYAEPLIRSLEKLHYFFFQKVLHGLINIINVHPLIRVQNPVFKGTLTPRCGLRTYKIFHNLKTCLRQFYDCRNSSKDCSRSFSTQCFINSSNYSSSKPSKIYFRNSFKNSFRLSTQLQRFFRSFSKYYFQNTSRDCSAFFSSIPSGAIPSILSFIFLNSYLK